MRRFCFVGAPEHLYRLVCFPRLILGYLDPFLFPRCLCKTIRSSFVQHTQNSQVFFNAVLSPSSRLFYRLSDIHYIGVRIILFFALHTQPASPSYTPTSNISPRHKTKNKAFHSLFDRITFSFVGLWVKYSSQNFSLDYHRRSVQKRVGLL